MSRAISAFKSIEPGTLRRARPGETLRCLVLADGPQEWAAVDLATGALVRARPGAMPVGAGGEILDVVDVVLADDPEPPDPARPEAVALAGEPVPVGKLKPRRARTVLDSLVPRRKGSQASAPLLGVVGPSASYGDLDGGGPSLEVVKPAKGPELVAMEGGVWCTFTLHGASERLPVLDRRAAGVANGLGGTVLTRAGVKAMLEFEPHYLLVGFVPPTRSHSRKAVLSILPRP